MHFSCAAIALFLVINWWGIGLAQDGDEALKTEGKKSIVQQTWQPIQAAWAKLYPVIRDRDQFPAAKSKAVDTFFAELLSSCESNCDKIGALLEGVQERVSGDQLPDLESVTKLWEQYGKNLSPQTIRARLPAIFHLARRIVALEEQNLFAMLAEGDPATNRINGFAKMAGSGTFVYRQGRALIRLGLILREIIAKAAESSNDAEVDGKTILAIKRFLGSAAGSIDDYLPRIVQAVEDLGVYYVKLAQTLGTLAYAFNPDAYEKLERFQSDNTSRMSGPEVVAAIEQDLGGPWQLFFSELNLVPFANASMAQIHEAKIRLDDSKSLEVVVKVKKGYIANELGWNQVSNALLFDWIRVDWLGGEDTLILDMFADVIASLGETFQSELDYTAEAQRQEFMRRTLGRSKGVYIPKVYTHLTGRNVITMEKVTGMQKFGASLRKSFAPPKPPREGDLTDSFSFKVGDRVVHIRDTDIDEGIESPETDTPDTVNAEPEVAASTVQDLPNQAGSADSPNAGLERGTAFANFYKTANRDLGFKIGAQYFQFFLRGLGPPISIFMAYSKSNTAIENAGGIDGLTPEQRVEWEALTKRFKILKTAMSDMTFHLGDLHSDLQPANAQERRDAPQIVLLDWGQVVPTKGLVFNPIYLTWSLMRGDEVGVAKAFSRMGNMHAGKTYKDLIPLVREFLDQAGFKKRGRIATFFALIRKQKKPPIEYEDDAEESKVDEKVGDRVEKTTDEKNADGKIPSVEEAPDKEEASEDKDVKLPSRLRPTFTPRDKDAEWIADDSEAEPLSMRPKKDAKKKKLQKKTPQQAVADVTRDVFDSILEYPARHAEYFGLRWAAKVAGWYDTYLGRRLARRTLNRRYQQSLEQGCEAVLIEGKQGTTHE